ncbi:unnamed protein product, partial [Polarella glacialis]
DDVSADLDSEQSDCQSGFLSLAGVLLSELKDPLKAFGESSSLSSEYFSSKTDRVQLAALLERVPVDGNNSFTSIGSLSHWRSQCTPCVFHGRTEGCACGVQCSYCHFPHARESAKLRRVFRENKQV